MKLICAVMPRSFKRAINMASFFIRCEKYLFFRYVICKSLFSSSLLTVLNCGQSSYFFSASFSKSGVNKNNNSNNNDLYKIKKL